MNLHYVKAVRPHTLLTEVQAAIPALVPVPGPIPGELVPVMTLTANATDCWMTVPETTVAADVDAVVATHDPTKLADWEALLPADQTALDAFRTGWILGQARLGNVGANAIQNQMDTIQAAQIGTVAAAAVHIKTLSEAVEDLARQLRMVKRAVAIPAEVPDRLGG